MKAIMSTMSDIIMVRTILGTISQSLLICGPLIPVGGYKLIMLPPFQNKTGFIIKSW